MLCCRLKRRFNDDSLAFVCWFFFRYFASVIITVALLVEFISLCVQFSIGSLIFIFFHISDASSEIY